MREKFSRYGRSYAACTAIGILIAGLVAISQGFDTSAPLAMNARWLSDGCFVAGMLMTGVGLLVWISTTGFFDMFSYGFHSLLVLFSPLRKPENHETFFDYKMAKDERRGKPLMALLIVGICFILLSMACLGVYYMAA